MALTGSMPADNSADKQGGYWLITTGMAGAPAALKLIVDNGESFAWAHVARATEWLATHTSIAVDDDGSKRGIGDDGVAGTDKACNVKGYQKAYLWLHMGAGAGTIRAELWGGLTTTCETPLGVFVDAQAGNMDDDVYAVSELPLKGAAYAQVKLVYSEGAGSITCSATLVVQG